jgi:hypothetical protein
MKVLAFIFGLSFLFVGFLLVLLGILYSFPAPWNKPLPLVVALILAARGRTTENPRAVTRYAAPERWCHPQASHASESPEGSGRHLARQRAQKSRKYLPSAVFQLARRARSQQLAQNQAQVERSYMDQLPLQNVLPPS